eukprot:g21716.t1
MKGKAKFGKNVTEQDKKAQEEAKNEVLVQAATQDISSLSYDNVEVLPDGIAAETELQLGNATIMKDDMILGIFRILTKPPTYQQIPHRFR